MAERQISRTRRMVCIALAIPLLALVGGPQPSVSGQAPREWRDYAGGPDSSRFVASTEINKSNVHQLQVAWTYPPGQTDFNPLVVRGVVYGLGANGMFVALDAATGTELWVHKGVQNFNGRGVNYWESKDGKDRRLIFSTNNILQAIDAQTGQTIPVVRRRRARRPPGGARPGSRDGEPAEPHPGSRLRGPDHSRLGDQSRVRVRARRHQGIQRTDRRPRLDLSYRAAARRVRVRHVAA